MIKQLLITVFLMVIFYPLLAFEQTNGPYGGDVRCTTIDSYNRIFIGTKNGGIFKSEDNAETWIAVNDGLTARDVWATTTDADDNVYAGTLGGGVFKSTDAGNNWTQVNNGIDWPFVVSLTANPQGYIFAGTSEGGGIYRSFDDGETWAL